MYYRMEIDKEGLVVIERPLFESIRVRFDEISSLEIYCKSIVPPLVSATFILIAQGILLSAGRGLITLISMPYSSQLILTALNMPPILCILAALVRVKYVTLRICFQVGDRPLVLHYVLRSVGEKFVRQYSRVRDSTETLEIKD
jgi:hypothetical protein